MILVKVGEPRSLTEAFVKVVAMWSERLPKKEIREPRGFRNSLIPL